MKKHFPNMLTCCNLVSGCIATHFALQASFQWAFAFIVIGAVFDFFDGFVARLLHVSSTIGKELDSLADDITFGFAPAAIVFSLLRLTLTPDAATCAQYDVTYLNLAAQYVPYVAFLIAAFSALRLAKFNIDERQTTSFIGLPTPANALFWASVAMTLHHYGVLGFDYVIAAALLAGVVLSSWLLVAEIPMFALKFKHYGIKGNEVRYGFMLFSLIILIAGGWASFSAIVVLYVLTSIANNLIGTKIAEQEE